MSEHLRINEVAIALKFLNNKTFAINSKSVYLYESLYVGFSIDLSFESLIQMALKLRL